MMNDPPRMNDTDMRFPLRWPDGRPRTRNPLVSAFKRDRTFAEARHALIRELDLLGARRVIISSNVPLRNDGLPRSGQPQPKDTGVAVYFELGAPGRPHAMACDRWRHVEDNLYALAKHVEAMRGQQRWGVASVEQAFAGFVALPPARASQSWRTVLGFGSEPVSRTAIEERFRALALFHHPDRGGTNEKMAELSAARDEALREATT